eukprot:5733685-Alexandrium_andersonii.AAC.1
MRRATRHALVVEGRPHGAAERESQRGGGGQLGPRGELGGPGEGATNGPPAEGRRPQVLGRVREGEAGGRGGGRDAHHG